jgi:hypothetical protein
MSFGIIKLELTSADLERMKERRFRTAVAQLEEIAQEGGRPIPALYHRLESSWNAGISRLEQQIYTSFSADVSLDVVRERISRLGRIVDENRLKEQARKVFRTMDEPFHEENWEQEWKLKVEESQRNMNETAETEQDIER